MLLHVPRTVHYALPHTGSIETIERMTGKKVHFYKVDLSHHAAVSKVFQKVVYETTPAFAASSNALRPRTNAFRPLTGRSGDGDIVARWQHWSLTLTGRLAVLLTQWHSSYTCILSHLTVVTLSGCGVRFVLCRMSNADFLVGSTKAGFLRLWIFKFLKWFLKCQLVTETTHGCWQLHF